MNSTVLTDVDNGVWLESWNCDASSGPMLAGSNRWSISKSTLRGGVSHGVDVVNIDNGELQMSLMPTRGMGLWRGRYHGIPIEWRSPVVRPVHPQFVNLKDRNGLGWLNGFNELMCRCGLSFNGPPGTDGGTDVTLHGKIANLAAHRVEAKICDEGSGTLSVTGEVDETTMFGPALRLRSTLSTVVGSNGIIIRDVVTNLGAQSTDFEILYHTNIGRPFMDEGARFVAPVAMVAPRDDHSANGMDGFDTYPGPIVGVKEEAFFFEMQADSAGQTRVMLVNAAGDRALSLAYSVQELPYFTLWKNPQADADGYVTGLEPGTNCPNFRSFERERGRVISLKPGATYECGFEMKIFDDARAVQAEIATIRALQKSKPLRHTKPINKFSPLS